MRFLSLVLISNSVGCVVHRMLPSGPVLDTAELVPYEHPAASGVRYTDEPRVSHPVLPFQVFGLYYDLDLVLITQDTGWDMHEYARIQTAGGPIWMAKDSRPDGVQTIVSDVTRLESLVAEVPVPRLEGPVDVRDQSEGNQVDVELSYRNPDGVTTEVQFTGTLPESPPSRRNGSTMGHSQQAVAAVLDLERFGKKNRVQVTMDGEDVDIKRLLGVVPMTFLLQQAQGGFAVSSWETIASDDGFFLSRPSNDGATSPDTGKPGWPTSRTERWTVEGDRVVGDFGLNRFEYRFVDRELVYAKVEQFSREVPVFELFLQPALPDLSRPFEGEAESSFRMDINGQRGHGTGSIRARWDDDQVEIEIISEAPWWLADRPMHGIILYPDEDKTEAWIHRSLMPK